MPRRRYKPVDETPGLDRREFVKTVGACSLAAGGLVLGVPAFGQPGQAPPPVETNIADFMKVPKTKHSLPGPFPGKVVKVTDPKSLDGDRFDAKVIARMFENGIRALTGKDMAESARMFFEPSDVVGLKVNPVGAPLIHTKPEVVDAAIAWVASAGVPKKNIVIWDRFDYMLADAGFTPERFPGVAIEGLQTMDERGKAWRDANGNHLSAGNFDKDVFYFAKGVIGKNVRGYRDDEFYLNQHVFNGEYSYFGNLLTKRLTKIVNLAAYKNTGAGISMATKNIGYGALCNTGRLHEPLFFKTNTEVHAAPVIRDKLVVSIIDGLRGQYDGGPDKNAQFVYANHSIYFATDPFALDTFCHNELMEKRAAMGIAVNDHPRFTEYLHYAEELGLGVVRADKMKVVRV